MDLAVHKSDEFHSHNIAPHKITIINCVIDSRVCLFRHISIEIRKYDDFNG